MAKLKRWKTTKNDPSLHAIYGKKKKVKSRKSTEGQDYKNGYEEDPLLSKCTSFSSFYKFEEDLDQPKIIKKKKKTSVGAAAGKR